MGMDNGRLSVLAGPDMPQVSTVDEAVRGHASRTPDAVALVWRGREISYRGLVAEVDRIRPRIYAGDCAPVAVRMERGPGLVATLLAVLETGAPYLALPPDWPVQHCRQAIAQAGVHLCLVNGVGPSGTVDGLRDLPGLSVIELDRDGMPDTEGCGVIRTRAPGDGCAVFHTSGSTGTPKSVLSPHAGIFRIAYDPRLGLDYTSRTVQAAPLGWDAFSLELWAPLLRGGSCLLYDGAYLTAAAVRAAIEGGVNTLWLTASIFNAFVDDDLECLRGLRLLMTGGERLSPHHVARCRALLPDILLVNGYGPAEATVFTSVHEIPATLDAAQDVSIGTAVAGTTIYLLDSDHRITKAGQPGEIAVAGAGLALRYLGDDEATRQSFPLLPLGPGGAPVRVYLTGDLGRIEEDGTLTFLGRLDRQVKIHGIRVDPIEVERAIEKTRGVSRAVVVPLPAEGTSKEYLAAFCVTEPGAAPTTEQIRDTVAEVLPQACVPRLVHVVADLPLNATGKVDTRRLLADLRDEPEPTAVFDASWRHVTLVRDHLSDLLGRAVHDDMDIFLAGATSLTAIRLSVRLENAVGVRLSAGAIMRSRTPVRIAELLAGTRPATEPA